MQEMRVLKGEVNKYKYNWRCVLVGACCTLRLITPDVFLQLERKRKQARHFKDPYKRWGARAFYYQ